MKNQNTKRQKIYRKCHRHLQFDSDGLVYFRKQAHHIIFQKIIFSKWETEQHNTLNIKNKKQYCNSINRFKVNVHHHHNITSAYLRYSFLHLTQNENFKHLGILIFVICFCFLIIFTINILGHWKNFRCQTLEDFPGF